MTAKGFSSRALARRSRSRVSPLAASAIRWKPPSPLTATMAPSRMAPTASIMAASPVAWEWPSASHHSNRGPHSGHALGWAWKRRSPGSSYSARHRGHMTKPFMEVLGRS